MTDCSKKNILITGATGFIGYALCRRFHQEGWQVRGAVRSLTDQNRLPEGVRAAPVGGIGQNTAWAPALAGVEIVVHLAARTHVTHEIERDPLAAYRLINVAGTEHLARMAADSGVRRFIYLSSVKVNGEGRAEPYSVQDVPAPEDPYGISKWEAEQVLHQIAEKTGMEISIIRPPLVYGPRVKGNFLALLKAVDHGMLLPFSCIRNQRSLIYLENLVDAIICCVAHQKAAGKTFLVSDGKDISTPELIRQLAEALGRRARLVPLSVTIIRILAKLLHRSSLAERLVGSLTIDSTTILKELNWSPPHTLKEGLGATAEWFKKQQETQITRGRNAAKR